MDKRVGASLEALAMMGVDYKTLELLDWDKPWHVMVDQEDKPKKGGFDYHGQNCKKMGEQDSEICLSREEEEYYFDFEGHMEDPDYMKKRLREWAKAVAAYVRFLDAHPSQYPHSDIR
ncbi:hypothetical protein SUGI_0067990 [Cryptomeria japonica]|nr:hypothetical protein SUGI_0067990 [Cryptomeria japonica]